MIGQTISHYRIVEKLGEGGMGVVYKALDITLDRSVALKFLPAHISVSEEVKARFLQEARAAAALNHAHICTVHGVEEDGSQMFIVMEYLDGGTLREKVPFSKIEDALTTAIQIGEALQEAHAKGIVHRDIKADNIMLTSKGQAKVMDFGLAKLRGSLKLTRTSSTVGTLAYMAPEQIQGGEVDSRSDIFSFGVLLFEMVTGKTPFRGEHEAAMMYSILNEEPFPVEQFRPEAPPLLSNVIQRCLEKDAADRYQSAGDVVIELRRVLKQSSKVHRTAAMHIPPIIAEERADRIPEAPIVAAAASASTSLKKFLWPAVALLIALAVLAVYKFSSGGGHPREFQDMKITRLTNSGKVNQAAVSPDGKYVVYAQEDAGKMSLWMRQTATTSNVQIVPPSESRYDRMNFSRDGNFIYVLKAEKEGELTHLYSMPVLGGAMRKLIHNLNTFTLSPDGNHIAFVRYTIGDATFELIVANADGTGERTIGQRKAPLSYDAIAWSPDGKVITCAFVEMNSVSVVSVPVEGGAGTVVSKHEWTAISSMEWLQDGSGIVVVPRDFISSAGAQIWQIAYPSGDARRITNDLNNYTSISLTADSKTLVTTEIEFNSTLWKLPAFAAGRNGWNADQATEVTSGKDDGASGVDLAPDGRIVYAASATGISQIWIIGPDGSAPRQLTSAEVPSANPEFSPDGKYIIFLRAQQKSLDIWRMNVDGTNAFPLTQGNYSFTPRCTPDSRWIVYSRVMDGKYNLWKVSIDGGAPVQITQKHSHTVAVSPDGKSIACEYQENENGTSHKLAFFPIEGGAPVKTLERQEYSRFAWLPDGRTLGVVEIREGLPNLWTIPLDGSPGKQLTHFKSNKIFDFAWARDGKSLVVARGPVVSDVIMIGNFR